MKVGGEERTRGKKTLNLERTVALSNLTRDKMNARAFE
jgi:hypothetical protein